MLRIKFIHRPKQPPRHEIQIPRIPHRFIIVSQRRAEDPGAVIIVQPHQQVLVVALRSISQRRYSVPDLKRFVQLLLDRGPILEALRNRMSRFGNVIAIGNCAPCCRVSIPVNSNQPL